MYLRRGITIVELMIVLGVLTIGLFAINQLIFTTYSTNSLGISYQQALLYAQEGLEVVRILKNESWQTNIAPLTAGTTYYPVLTGSVWSLALISPGLLDNVFSRSLVVQDVYRDTDSNIASSGTLDPDAKKITVTVQWQDSGRTKQIVIPAYMTNL